MISFRSQCVMLSAVLLVGCGDAGGEPAGDVDGSVSGDPDAGPVALPDAASNDPALADEIEDDVVGIYASRMVVATRQEVPLLGPTDATSTSLGLATITRNGDVFDLVETGCRVEASGSSAVTTVIPDVIVETTPAITSQLAFARQGSDIVWSRPETVTLVSVDLDDPSNDALPTSADDPRVLDQDGDSNPGVTVKVMGLASGDIYVVQRNRGAYGGELEGAGRLSGLVTDRSDQSVIGSSNPVLNQNIPTQPHDDPSRSTIVLVRVDDSYDCAKLLAEREQLF